MTPPRQVKVEAEEQAGPVEEAEEEAGPVEVAEEQPGLVEQIAQRAALAAHLQNIFLGAQVVLAPIIHRHLVDPDGDQVCFFTSNFIQF